MNCFTTKLTLLSWAKRFCTRGRFWIVLASACKSHVDVNVRQRKSQPDMWIVSMNADEKLLCAHGDGTRSMIHVTCSASFMICANRNNGGRHSVGFLLSQTSEATFCLLVRFAWKSLIGSLCLLAIAALLYYWVHKRLAPICARNVISVFKTDKKDVQLCRYYYFTICQ